MATRTTDLAAQLRRFGDWAEGRSPLYQALAPAVVADPDLLALADLAPPGQPTANLLFAAVQDLLLQDSAVPLAAQYPGLADGRAATGDAFDQFRAYALDRRDAIAATMRTRRVQTNEPARTALLLPALALAHGTLPVALLEVGTSAGLNLLVDRYAFDYGDGPRGAPDAPVTFACDPRGTLPALPRTAPPIAWRLGLDLAPVDIADPAERRWLRALVWPGDGCRARQLEAALALAAVHPPPVRIGDASRDLDTALGDAPDDAQAVVLHAFMINQLDMAARRRFRAALWRAARTRPVVRIGIEYRAGLHATLEIERFANGRAQRRALARCDPHGAWLEWRG